MSTANTRWRHVGSSPFCTKCSKQSVLSYPPLKSTAAGGTLPHRTTTSSASHCSRSCGAQGIDSAKLCERAT
eukprot:3389040-Pleurochrysis_carterae.AAC.1